MALTLPNSAASLQVLQCVESSRGLRRIVSLSTRASNPFDGLERCASQLVRHQPQQAFLSVRPRPARDEAVVAGELVADVHAPLARGPQQDAARATHHTAELPWRERVNACNPARWSSFKLIRSMPRRVEPTQPISMGQ